MKKLFIITGEYSGDMHASYVVEQLKDKNIQIEAIGGVELAKRGIKLFCDHSKMNSVGISPKIIFEHIMLGKNLINYLKNDYKPDAVLLIDYGGFNLKIAQALKNTGIKVFYYICPQLWATRYHRIKAIKKYVDKVYLTLPFEKEIYDKENIPNEFVGHPLISQLPKDFDREDFFKKNNLDFDKKIVGIFPGSRVFEIKNLLNTFIKSAEKIAEKHKDIQFCLAQAPNLKDDVIQKYFKDTNLDIKILKNQNHELLKFSDALILASGTVALEAMLYETPMIISYKAPWILYLGYLLLRNIKYVCLCNIILNEEVVPELIQHKSNQDMIFKECEQLLFDENKRDWQLKKYQEIKKLLSSKISSKEVAMGILEEI